MNSIEFFYLSTTFVSVMASLPQIKQLWVMKNSDEFNLITWAAWLTSQFAALIYSISIGSVIYITINLIWFVFDLSMYILILKYRHHILKHLHLAYAKAVNK